MEEQRGVRRALGPPQGLEGQLGLAFVQRYRGIDDPQIGVARTLALQGLELETGALDLALVEQVPDVVDLLPLGLTQRLVIQSRPLHVLPGIAQSKSAR